jgi:type I site-specific restriction endonuclease
MGDDSSRGSIVKSLKNEWSLLWEAFNSDDQLEQQSKDPFETGKLEVLTLDEVRELTKTLVENRKKLNQNLESVVHEIDLSTAKLENLQLVGAASEDIIKKINELTDLGQSMSTALSKIDHQLRLMREQESQLNENWAP